MLFAQQQDSQSTAAFFLQAGSTPILLGFGIVLGIWGLANLVRSSGRTSILSQSLLSLLPAVISLVLLLGAYHDFSALATSTEAPKPTQIASVIGRSFSVGIVGLISTCVPLALGIFAFSQCCRRLEIEASTARHES